MIISLNVYLLLLIATSAVARDSQNENKNKMFFVQRKDASDENPSSKLLIVTWSPENNEETNGCEYFKDQELIKEVLDAAPNAQVRVVNEDEMEGILEDCTEITMRRKRQTDGYNYYTTTKEPYSGKVRKTNQTGSQNEKEDVTTTEKSPDDQEYSGIPVILPGTKWCGAGDIAKSFNDLGLNTDTDKCCRAHDLCNDTMAPGASKYNLTNTSTFTKLSCQCDEEFYDCLSKVDSVVSNGLGNLYFNVLKRECYKYDYPPSSKCKKYRSLLRITCKEYEKNTTSPKVYHWVPARRYTKLPVPGPISVSIDF